MWRDILLHNKDVMLRLLSEWRQEMERVEQLLHEENKTGIYDYFFQAKETRDQLPTNKKRCYS